MTGARVSFILTALPTHVCSSPGQPLQAHARATNQQHQQPQQWLQRRDCHSVRVRRQRTAVSAASAGDSFLPHHRT